MIMVVAIVRRDSKLCVSAKILWCKQQKPTLSNLNQKRGVLEEFLIGLNAGPGRTESGLVQVTLGLRHSQTPP